MPSDFGVFDAHHAVTGVDPAAIAAPVETIEPEEAAPVETIEPANPFTEDK